MRVGGGLDSGRTLDDVCFNIDSPSAVAASLPGVATAPIPHTATTIDGKKTCRIVTSLAGNTQVKLNGSVPLPGAAMVSATLQSLPGLSYIATYAATTAEIAPSLGRNLSGGAANMTVNIVQPCTIYGERSNQVGLRLAKILRVDRVRTTASLDIYNLLNANAVLTESNAFASWQRPQSILNPRWAKVVLQVDF